LAVAVAPLLTIRMLSALAPARGVNKI
jgi:hypothetical protein